VTALVGRAALAVIVLTLVFGLGYPLVMTGFARVAFPNRSNASLIERDGTVVGSKLAGQKFTSPKYFHSRPSAVDYNAAGTSFANYGPTSPELAKSVRDAARAVLKLEAPHNPGLTIGDIPVDAVTTSGSGIDPHISPAYARLQAARIASVRNLPKERVLDLIDESTDGRSLGFLGEPGVNVLELNLALDREGAA
jgi:K+-transporting ATPase ATPase C chain